jgi:hypothetical protein
MQAQLTIDTIKVYMPAKFFATVMLWLERPDTESPTERYVASRCPPIVSTTHEKIFDTSSSSGHSDLSSTVPSRLSLLYVSVKSQSATAASFLHPSRPRRLLP